MERSTGGMEREISSYRTSSTSWLMSQETMRDPVTTSVTDRIAKITGLPFQNHEHFQVLKYKEGQYYREHHDWIDEQDGSPCGPRVATFFLYLSDVEEGGGTYFRKLGLEVRPKSGRAILWYNALPTNPPMIDNRMQ